MYIIKYDMEYADGTKGTGSHGDFETYADAVEALNEMRDHKYTAEELEYAVVYSNFEIEADDEYEDDDYYRNDKLIELLAEMDGNTLKVDGLEFNTECEGIIYLTIDLDGSTHQITIEQIRREE